MPTTLPRVCSRCGRAIPPGNLGDRCPSCLLDFALETVAADSEEHHEPRPEPAKPAGRRFQGNYEILNEIARGGMGVVYRARQLGVDRLVALKMIQGSALASPEARMRFELEAAAIGRLDHPNIISLIETGEHNSELFIALGLVEGCSLAQLSAACVRRDGDWLRKIAGLLATVARAIHYAHQRGVLHRDLKPSNILVDDNGEPKITDFGLAKVRETDAGLTRSGAVLGSPNYMSPEQAAGPPHLLTTAADVYSLGAILYEMICGRAPFEASTAVETMRRVVDTMVEAPRRRNPAVDCDLESICLKCLEKEPQRRYASASDLGADLERWLTRRPTLARPMSRLERLWRWCRWNPALATLSALSSTCFAVLAVGAAVALHRIQIANFESEALLRRLQLEQVESYFTEGDSARGIALLAYLLRAQPHDAAIGVRLKSALELRPIARPFTQPWLSGSEILVLGFDATGSRSVALSRQADLHIRDLESNSFVEYRLSGGDPITHATLGADAAWLATAHDDASVRLWDLVHPNEPRRVLPHPDSIGFIVFDPTAAMLATGCEDGSVRIWDANTGTLLRTPLLHPALSRAGVFSPDGNHLAIGCEDGSVRLWPVFGGDAIRTFEHRQGGVRVLNFDAQGTRLAAGTVDGQVWIWDLSSTPTSHLELVFPAVLTDLQFSPDGRLLAVAGWSPHATAQVWDTHTGQAAGPPLAHRANVLSVRFSPDGRRLLTLSMDTTARVWNTSDWTPALDALVHVGGVTCGAWTGDSRRIVTGSYAGVVWWELPASNEGGATLEHPAQVLTATVASETGRLLTIASDGILREWGFDPSRAFRELKLPVDKAASAVFSAAGRSVAVLVDGREMHVFDTDQGLPRLAPIQLDNPMTLAAISPNDDAVLASTPGGDLWRFPFSTRGGTPVELCQVNGLQGAVFSPDGSRVATYSFEHIARIWDANTGQPLTPALRHEGAVDQAVFSPDGSLLATAAADSRARVWNASNGRLVGGPFPHNAGVDVVAFHPLGQALATTSADGAARIWQIGGHDTSPVTIQHSAHIGQMVFDSKGHFLLTVSQDGVVRAWDSQTGVPLIEPLRHPIRVKQTGFQPDARSVWTLTVDGVVRQWSLPSYDPADIAWLPDQAEQIGRMYLDRPNRFRVTSTDRWKNPSDRLQDGDRSLD